MTAATLVADDLAVSRGERPLFRGLGFRLEAGTALLLRGPNGSGKSTLLRALLGLATTERGRLDYGGRSFEPRSGELRGHAIYLGHASGMKAELSARQALGFAAELDGSPHDPVAVTAALAEQGLTRRAAVACRQLSQGQRQRLALARLALSARAAQPRWLWLLDEPQTALDSEGLAQFDQGLADHLQRGGSAIIAAHGAIASGIAAVATLELGQYSARRRGASAADTADTAAGAAATGESAASGNPS